MIDVKSVDRDIFLNIIPDRL